MEKIIAEIIAFLKEPLKDIFREVIAEGNIPKIGKRAEDIGTSVELKTLTRNELSENYKISKVTIWKLMKSGKLPYHRIGSKKILFYEDEVESAFPVILKRRTSV